MKWLFFGNDESKPGDVGSSLFADVEILDRLEISDVPVDVRYKFGSLFITRTDKRSRKSDIDDVAIFADPRG